jgi:hypothetical protein
MFYDKSDPDFPNWWEVIYEGEAAAELSESVQGDAEGVGVEAETHADSVDSDERAGDSEAAESPAIRYIRDEDDEEEDLAPRFSKKDEEHVNAEEGPVYEAGSEYDREVVCRVWEFAEAIQGNDSDLWRKDEYGNWIYRLDYGKHDSEFGWEIFDPAPGRRERGVYALRPLQWESFVKHFDSRG